MNFKYKLYECTYGCKNLHISLSESYSTKCPKCSNLYQRTIIDDVNPNLNFVKMKVVTFNKNRFYKEQDYDKYKKDLLLDELEANGFKLVSISQHEIKLVNSLVEVAYFEYSKYSLTTLYLGLHLKNDSLLEEVSKCIKNDKINKKNEPPPPKIKSMKDAMGQDITVGDWVCAWGTSNLSFGKIKSIEKFKENDYDKDVKIGARILKGKTTLPIKTSDQIFRLTPEQALLLALEQ